MVKTQSRPELEERLWTAAELAERYGLSELTLRQWRWRGTGPRPVKIGRRPMYPQSEIARWERERALAS